MGYSFRLAARVLLYAPSHWQDSTYHCLFTPVMEHRLEREIAQWVHHEGLIQWPITPRVNALTTELHLDPTYWMSQLQNFIQHEWLLKKNWGGKNNSVASKFELEVRAEQEWYLHPDTLKVPAAHWEGVAAAVVHSKPAGQGLHEVHPSAEYWSETGTKEILFNDALNTFYLWLNAFGHVLLCLTRDR